MDQTIDYKLISGVGVFRGISISRRSQAEDADHAKGRYEEIEYFMAGRSVTICSSLECVRATKGTNWQLRHQLAAQMVKGRQADEFLFTRENGKPVKDFRAAWDVLTESANMPGLLFHDLRRSAVRNLVRRGVTLSK